MLKARQETGSLNEQVESDFLGQLGAMGFERDRLPDLEEIRPDSPVTYKAYSYGNLLMVRVFAVSPVDIMIELKTGGQIGVASGAFDDVGQPSHPWRIMGSLVAKGSDTYLRVRGVIYGDRVEHRFVTAGEGGVTPPASLSLTVVDPVSSEVVSGKAGSEIHAYPILRKDFQANISANGSSTTGRPPGSAHTLFVNINGKDHTDAGTATSFDAKDVKLTAAAALHARIVGPDKKYVRLSVTKVIFPKQRSCMSRNDREGRYLGCINGQHKRTRKDALTIRWKAQAKRQSARGEDSVF